MTFMMGSRTERVTSRWVIASIVVGAVAVGSGVVLAQNAKGTSNRTQEEVAAHRQMARVHEEAARCLESGQSEKACHEQLARDCKGVGIGKHCGMRHKH
jgi:hypothetical protein